MSLKRAIFSYRRGEDQARFELIYRPHDAESVVVGHLSVADGVWRFQYAPEYRERRTEFRPIEGFKDLDKVYESSVLFPFFAVRIPDEDRPDVRERLAAERIRKPRASDMLRLFGRHVISSPAFELIPT